MNITLDNYQTPQHKFLTRRGNAPTPSCNSFTKPTWSTTTCKLFGSCFLLFGIVRAVLMAFSHMCCAATPFTFLSTNKYFCTRRCSHYTIRWDNLGCISFFNSILCHSLGQLFVDVIVIIIVITTIGMLYLAFCSIFLPVIKSSGCVLQNVPYDRNRSYILYAATSMLIRNKKHTLASDLLYDQSLFLSSLFYLQHFSCVPASSCAFYYHVGTAKV